MILVYQPAEYASLDYTRTCGLHYGDPESFFRRSQGFDWSPAVPRLIRRDYDHLSVDVNLV